MTIRIDPRMYDPGARLTEDKCSIYECLLVSSFSFLVMDTTTTNQKIGCVAGCTVLGAGIGGMVGFLGGPPGIGLCTAYGAAGGCAVGIIKVAVDSCRRNCH